ncbi:unnamed protein product [Parnassius mnemosyne]|uniref:Lipase domain-containing protein n=1 Tax=Parnassius mnemosyne TaxID=213953 RepID=A0AAV1LZQ7_9NEOP
MNASVSAVNMLKGLYFFVAVLAGCHAAVTSDVQRSGSVNRYFVYTRANIFEPREILLNDPTTITESGIINTHDTVVIVHGHQASAFNSLNPTLKNAYLQNYEVNVIVVDWSIYARKSYSSAVSAVPSVGTYLGDLISILINANLVELNRLHLIGFNLGAHVVGFAGRKLQGQVARVTGLDPSGKQWGSNSGRLTSSDARYVEIIHTDTHGIFANGIGTALGHIDFYPNGGSNQPGCLLSNSCSHNRAWEFFAATLLANHQLLGNNCASTSQLTLNRCNGDRLAMGTNSYSKLGGGIYRVNTGTSYPF